MWIVRLALRRPYTFVVAAMLVAILGIYTILNTPTDIFPEINIPVISVVFNYTGMAPADVEKRMITQFEQILTTTVNDIEHIESQSLSGIGVVKIYFQPGAKIEEATAQVTAIGQTAIRIMPPGTQPPLILQYNASNVPVLQLSLGSDTMSEQDLFDQTVHGMRPQLITIKGVQCPYPYGGKQRQIMVDIDPQKLYGFGISPEDVSNALNRQSLILPAGTEKIGTQELPVLLNASPLDVNGLNNLPIKTVNGATIYIKDVAHVRDGFQVQTNIVHVNGKLGVLQSILKSGGASTLDVVSNILKSLPQIKTTLPQEMSITPLFDQSIFVRAAVSGVVREAAIAAGLTGMMILLFLGSWRSTLIVMISIPLSILVSIIVLSAIGETLNVMTLGGMALAVGILVDDATVEIENIHRNLHQHKRLVAAILDGASQIAVPAFVSTLCICIVFVPVAFISGSAKFLFTPLAEAVVFAMLTSYLLSRTLVPTMVHYLLAGEAEMYGGVLDPDDPHAAKAIHEHEVHHDQAAPRNIIWRVHDKFNERFEKLRHGYGGFLAWALEHRLAVIIAFTVLVLVSCALFPIVGTDFFPNVDAGVFRLHVRAPAGTRIEQTSQDFAQVEEAIRKVIPPSQIDTVIDNIGIPNSSINLSLSDGSLNSPADGEILVSLKSGHTPTEDFQRTLRKTLSKQFPDLTFFFAPADIVSQVLNFGLAAPVDIQVTGIIQNLGKNEDIARQINHEVAGLPGIVDARVLQVAHTPDIQVNMDRTLTERVGMEAEDVASDLLVSLSSSGQTAPNYWLNPQNGLTYNMLVQTPQYDMDTMNELDNTPIATTDVPESPGTMQLLSNVAQTERQTTPTSITHYNLSPSFDVAMNVQGTDLGTAAKELNAVVDKYQKQLPRGSFIHMRGQVQSMHDSFTGLSIGLIFAVVLVYLLMVINFQSWIDPLIILMALPGALSGILWILWTTGTTISVPALMGAIMSIGVATSNSILMITFANDQRKAGMNAHDAALAAGLTRLRPVIMTALAMIIGMLPMSLSLGEGGEQNAPLGRAVIGGLSMATFATLFFVPVMYSLMRQKPPQTHVEKELM